MSTNTFSIWPLMWQVFNVSLLVAVVVMGCRLLWLLWARRKTASAEVTQAPEATLGKVIRQNRIRCKMTQEFVADALRVSRQAVSKWESGASEPSTSNLLALAKLFQVDAAEMLRAVK